MAKEKDSNLHWHPAFVEALGIELKEYSDKIEILPEFQLTTEPLRIDCVVIKKTKDLVIKKNFAAIFREWNILEYKNPRDHVSVNDFHKVYAYACLYSVLNKIPVDNISISFIESRHPKKLIDFLERVRHYTVEKNDTGIYTINGDVFAMQIIDSRYLSDSDNLWLKNLHCKHDRNTAAKLYIEINKDDNAGRLRAYIDVVSRANPKAFKEVLNMRAPTLMELVEETEVGKEWKKELEVKGRAEGEAKGKAEVARNLKSIGISNDLISQSTGLSLSEINML
ncbi:MAG: hypothetical protein LBI04_04190 [Treponema sp.]|nr:hypothetical protein [Treponema sp.]